MTHQVNFKLRDEIPYESSLYKWLKSFDLKKADVIRLALMLLKSSYPELDIFDFKDHVVDDNAAVKSKIGKYPDLKKYDKVCRSFFDALDDSNVLEVDGTGDCEDTDIPGEGLDAAEEDLSSDAESEDENPFVKNILKGLDDLKKSEGGRNVRL